MWKDEKGTKVVFLEKFQICQGENKNNEGENETVFGRKFYPFIWTVFKSINKKELIFLSKRSRYTSSHQLNLWADYFQFMPLSKYGLWKAMKFLLVSKMTCQYAWQRSFSRRRAFTLFSFFIEMTHSTGHEKQVRPDLQKDPIWLVLGFDEYSKEGINLAEMGAKLIECIRRN